MEVQWVVDAKAGAGESPVWCAEEEVLYWVDISGCLLHRFDPTNGDDCAYDMSAPIGCVAQRRSGGLLVALKTGLFGFAPAAGVLELLADPARSPFRRPLQRWSQRPPGGLLGQHHARSARPEDQARQALSLRRAPTMLAFGGRELDVVFVTSMHPQPHDPPAEQPPASGLFAFSDGIQGLPEPRFAG